MLQPQFVSKSSSSAQLSICLAIVLGHMTDDPWVLGYQPVGVRQMEELAELSLRVARA